MPKKPIRPIRVEGNTAYVPLTQGYEAIIDAFDIPLINNSNWLIQKNAKTCYAKTYFIENGKQRICYMHRLLLNAKSGENVDHIDGNGLHNKKQNLRKATKSQNGMNRGRQSDNKSGIKGVSLHKVSKKWVASIKRDGKKRHLGLFANVKDAADAYAKAAKELHAEYMRLE